MPTAFPVQLVSPEAILFEGEAEMVVARAVSGSIAFLYGHVPYLGALDTIEETGSLTTHEYRYTREGFELSRDGVEIPVRSGDHVIGRFVLIPTPGVGISKEDRLVARALADQVGIVLGRAA